MRNYPFSAIGFDLDGVLIDSVQCMAHSWAAVCRKFSLDIDFSHYRQHIGIPFADILANLGIDKSLHKAMASEYFANTARNQHHITLYPQVIETLDKLRAEKIKTFIITSKPRASTMRLLAHFGIGVDYVICGDDVARGKPHPMAGTRAIEKLDLAAETTAFVGDMPTDYLFAKAVNFRFIYARYGYGSIECDAADIFPIQAISDLLSGVGAYTVPVGSAAP